MWEINKYLNQHMVDNFFRKNISTNHFIIIHRTILSFTYNGSLHEIIITSNYEI